MERAVQTVESQIRVMKISLEARLGIQVDAGAKIVAFMAEYASFLLNPFGARGGRKKQPKKELRKIHDSAGHRVWRKTVVEGKGSVQDGQDQLEM